MNWLDLPRVPEPEVMEESGEVEAYASATAQAWLDHIDSTFVEHALGLGVQEGRALDIGTGPGQIPIKLAGRLSRIEVTGIDRSESMLEQGSKEAQAKGLRDRVRFQAGDGNRLDFPDGSFDLVLCNSVLHHLQDPVRVLKEIGRVAKPEGAILLRDLRRPSRPLAKWHLWRHGRHYGGRMKELFEASVRAAYTVPEVEALLVSSGLKGARVFRYGSAHIGIERPAGGP